TQFTKGEQVEILKPDPNTTNDVVYYPATVLRSPALHKNLISIEHHQIKEYVDLDSLRPTPPRELNRCFIVGDHVDAFFESECVWRRGVVGGILENSKVVGVNGRSGESEIQQWNLRVHRDWDDGSWVPPLPLQNKLSETEEKPKKVRLKITCGRTKLEENFRKGAMVEVSSDEEGYKGSWYSAIIVDFVRNNKILVEYLTLKTDDESRLLREETDAQYVRPYPPHISRVAHFKPIEQVDAWYNEGWWLGVISRVLNRFKYIFYFRTSNEELEFKHSDLRPHQDWINGRWLIASKVYFWMLILFPFSIYSGEKSSRSKSSRGIFVAWTISGNILCQREFDMRERELEFKSKELELKTEGYQRYSKPEFRKWMKVEVKSDEVGYEGSWYSAVIVDSMGNDMYLVEYLTLRTDDESEFLREEANASDIRPSPPCIQRVYSYDLLENVDAWYNDGWWVGQISKVFNGLKYRVYFRPTQEELEFDHCDLRPHQEWIEGKWLASSRV
ncbi:LOW QUALITY PROTEIN: Agenet domain-containing protein, partial [Cephalotus follicularis]